MRLIWVLSMSKINLLNELLRWKSYIPADEILQMEDYLGRKMSPVRPREDFIHSLREGLTHSDTKAAQPASFSLLEKLLWIGAGFVSAIVFVMLGVRVIVNLVRGSNLRGYKRVRKAKSES